ncbi:MAG TPA: transketolase C-terminal domain-containing protein [Anaerolineales bacterium]|nr:transketolase C-terminal domain-containing protein [Anaerolineales bacterium]HRK89659.1 transketolase C-terminal domain-containing protein [Anaerolineales bacterium]
MAENNGKGNAVEMRDAFGSTLVELGKKYPNMIMLDADLHTSSKATMFKKAYPDRFIQVGIAEQNLFGISAGIALSGFMPFPSTFAVFASRRALDQIAISICFPNLNVKIPGSYVGLPTSRAGASHNCIEDIAVMRALPNMRVADPADAADLRAIMYSAAEVNGPVYFRIARLAMPSIFGNDHVFEWGKGVLLRDGRDVTLFGTGIMTTFCLKAADLLASEGISAEVIHLASIKPIDANLIVESAGRTGCAVTAENATINGGFGSAVAEVLGEECPVPHQRIGVRDRWADSGGIKELFTHHGMQPEDIAAAAKKVIQQKSRVRT